MKTEADILRALAAATTLREQAELVGELDQLSTRRTASIQASRDVDLADSIIRETLSPVRVHEHHTASTDWLEDVSETPLEETKVLAEASLWFQRTSSFVRSDVEEFGEQAKGMASRVASAYGANAAQARRAFLDYVSFLYAQAASGLDQIEQTVDPDNNPKATPLPAETYDTFADPVAPENAGIDEQQSSYNAPLLQEILQGGGGQGQPEIGVEHDGADEQQVSSPNFLADSAGPEKVGSVAISHLINLDDFKRVEAVRKQVQASKKTGHMGGNPPKFTVGDRVKSFRGEDATVHRVEEATQPGKSHRVQVRWDDPEKNLEWDGREHPEGAGDKTAYYETVFDHHPGYIDEVGKNVDEAMSGLGGEDFLKSNPEGPSRYSKRVAKSGYCSRCGAHRSGIDGNGECVECRAEDTNASSGNSKKRSKRVVVSRTTRQGASSLDQIQQIVDNQENPKPTPLPEEVAFPLVQPWEPQSTGDPAEQLSGPEHLPTSSPKSAAQQDNDQKIGRGTCANCGTTNTDVVWNSSSQKFTGPGGECCKKAKEAGGGGHLPTSAKRKRAVRKTADEFSDGAMQPTQDPVPTAPADSEVSTSGGYGKGYTDGKADASSGEHPTFSDNSSGVTPYVQGYSKGFSEVTESGAPSQGTPTAAEPTKPLLNVGSSLKKNAALKFITAKTQRTRDFKKAYAYALNWNPRKPAVRTGSVEFESGLFAGMTANLQHQDAWVNEHQRLARKGMREFADRIAVHRAYTRHIEVTGGTTTDLDINDPAGTADPGGQTPLNGIGTEPPLAGGSDPAAPGGAAPYNGAEPFSQEVTPAAVAPADNVPTQAPEDEPTFNARSMAFRKRVQANLAKHGAWDMSDLTGEDQKAYNGDFSGKCEACERSAPNKCYQHYEEQFSKA